MDVLSRDTTPPLDGGTTGSIGHGVRLRLFPGRGDLFRWRQDETEGWIAGCQEPRAGYLQARSRATELEFLGVLVFPAIELIRPTLLGCCIFALALLWFVMIVYSPARSPTLEARRGV